MSLEVLGWAIGCSVAYVMMFVLARSSSLVEDGEVRSTIMRTAFNIPMMILAYVTFLVSAFFYVGVQGTEEHYRRTSAPASRSTNR